MTCQIDASPARPSPIITHSIEVFDFYIEKETLFLNLSWQLPPAPHGGIDEYNVQVITKLPENERDEATIVTFARVHLLY